MTDAQDHDALEIRLRAALRDEASRATTPPVAVADVRAGAARRDRWSRARAGTVALAAAAILIAVLVVRMGAEDDAYVDLLPDGTKPPLHLVLDEAAGHEIWTAQQGLTADPRPSDGQPRLDDLILYGGTDGLDPPWLLLAAYSEVAPFAPLVSPVDGEQPISIAGRDAVVRSFPEAGPTSGHQILVSWDGGRTVNASFWGMTVADATRALEALRFADGRYALVGSSLAELARVVHPPVVDPAEASVTNYSPRTPDGFAPMAPAVMIQRDPQARTEADLLASVLLSYWPVDVRVERIDVRGNPGLVLIPTSASTRLPSALNRTTVVWFEPDHDTLVTLSVDGSDRAEAERLIGHLREADADEWAAILASCTDVLVGGTVATNPAGVVGGPCPGYEQRGG
jgi:hypothetical protein